MINVVSVSGGKDSTATLLLAVERNVENIRAVFMDTGNEHEATYEYLSYLEDSTGLKIERIKADASRLIENRRKIITEDWTDPDSISQALEHLHPTGIPFLDHAIAFGFFPAHGARWCTNYLKVSVFRNQVVLPALAEGADLTSWQGVRRDESRARSCLEESEFLTRDDKTGAEAWIYRPILDWKAEDCFAMIQRHGLKPNPLYKLGFSRVGCMPCIMNKKAEIALMAERFPDHVERIRKWEQIVSKCTASKRSSFFFRGDENSTIDEYVAWARTDRGGKQIPLFADWKDPPSCSSVYGLCE